MMFIPKMPDCFKSAPSYQPAVLQVIDLDQYNTAVIRKYPARGTMKAHLRTTRNQLCDLTYVGEFPIPASAGDMDEFRYLMMKAASLNYDGQIKLRQEAALAQSVQSQPIEYQVTQLFQEPEDAYIPEREDPEHIPESNLAPVVVASPDSKLLGRGKFVSLKLEKYKDSEDKSWVIRYIHNHKEFNQRGNDLKRAVSGLDLKKGDSIKIYLAGSEPISLPGGRPVTRKKFIIEKESQS
jgi:hypothetical protein